MFLKLWVFGGIFFLRLINRPCSENAEFTDILFLENICCSETIKLISHEKESSIPIKNLITSKQKNQIS
jgi:hypothetical protein